MVLLDTSVLINYLRGKDNLKTRLLKEVLFKKIPVGISPFTYQEVLQGAKDKGEFDLLKHHFSKWTIYYLPERENYEKAAELYFELRRKGLTPRSTIDILIAITAIEYDLVLLHDDRDFDEIATFAKELRCLHSFTGQPI